MKLIDIYLTEGLFANDLSGMILPLLSINEYSTKVSKNAIVIAFFSKNPDAAEDLSVFIEKSAIEEILDAEVSSAPDEDGDYLTFVEIERKDVETTILEILKIVNYVCPTKKWEFQAYKLPRVYELTKSNLEAYFKKIDQLKL
jgi:hypothetical protein